LLASSVISVCTICGIKYVAVGARTTVYVVLVVLLPDKIEAGCQRIDW